MHRSEDRGDKKLHPDHLIPIAESETLYVKLGFGSRLDGRQKQVQKTVVRCTGQVANFYCSSFEIKFLTRETATVSANPQRVGRLATQALQHPKEEHGDF